ncbi:RNA recognition motif 2-domain-containing protein [Sporodiniella umbellata]|nr:RNA recognition motif 2-domain-containing protein [Sporodiniella umbellata]
MIRNIPNKYTQAMLKHTIDTTHKNTYDFLYLRMDFKNHCNVGYAFINFIDNKSVVTFAEKRIGKKWSLFNSDKRFSLSFAKIQGKKALVQRFKNSDVMLEEESYRPMLFYSRGDRQGQEQPFPLSEFGH